MRANHTFSVEPRGSIYRQLVDYALASCSTALLVVRKEMPLDQRALEALEHLEPFFRNKADRGVWPGTELIDHTADVRVYRFCPESARVIATEADGLFDWCQPALPEDLCLLRDDGDAWLVTIAHERDAYVCLSEEELARIRISMPLLKLHPELGLSQEGT